MPISDGRIRSKDLDSGAANSRVIDNLHSSNYDGSLTNPNADAGSLGWLILKSGLVVFSQAIIRGTIEAAEIVAAVIRGGQLDVTEGGTINVANGGSIQVGDFVTLGETGLQIGDDVVIDSTGLFVNGGRVQSVWPFTAGDDVNDTSLTTTPTDKLTVTIDPPNDVEILHLISTARGQISNSSGGLQNIVVGVTNDDGGASEQRASGNQTSDNNWTASVTVVNRDTITLTPAGRTVDVVLDAWVNAGTNSTNLLDLNIIGFGLRV